MEKVMLKPWSMEKTEIQFLDPADLTPDMVVERVINTALKLGCKDAWRQVANDLQRDIGYDMFHEQTLAEIFRRHANPKDRKNVPYIGVCLKTTMAYAYGEETARQVCKDLKELHDETEKEKRENRGLYNTFTLNKKIEARFREIIGDDQIADMFINRFGARVTELYKNHEHGASWPAEKTIREDKKIGKLESFTDFTTRKTVKPDMIRQALENALKSKKATIEAEFWGSVRASVQKMTRYDIDSMLIRHLARRAYPGETFTALESRLKQRMIENNRGQIVAPTKDIKLQDLKRREFVARTIKEAEERPTGKTRKGKNQPVPRIKKDHNIG